MLAKCVSALNCRIFFYLNTHAVKIALWGPLRGRRLRGNLAKCVLQLMQRLGSHRPPLRGRSFQVHHLREGHAETDHRCPVEGYKAGRGHPCSHGTTKCANCGRPHGARADACAAKRKPAGKSGAESHRPHRDGRGGSLRGPSPRRRDPGRPRGEGG